MAEKTLYDLLEVSNTASVESIRAAYERLSAKFDPANTGSADARFQSEAIKDAFFTLSNTEKRAQYDRKLEQRSAVTISQVQVIESFWTLPKLIVVGVVVLSLGGFYYKHQQTQARLEAEKVIATAKAKEAEEKAKAEAEADRIALQREREQKTDERRRYYEQQSAVRQYQGDSRMSGAYSRSMSNADQQAAQRAEMNRRNEESRAASASRQQLARDRAELCRMEYERYGRSISC